MKKISKCAKMTNKHRKATELGVFPTKSVYSYVVAKEKADILYNAANNDVQIQRYSLKNRDIAVLVMEKWKNSTVKLMSD